jgi:uncharacterized membrane protein
MDFTPLILTAIGTCAGLVVLYVGLVRLAGPRRRLEEELSVQALRSRLASGEITPEEFAQAKRALGR